MKCHCETEHSEDDVRPPLDILKGRWNEVSECKVEDLWRQLARAVRVGNIHHTQLQEVANATAFPLWR
jgi:hypothetical protein